MPIGTRTFRVFVSSTFEDLKAERDALQRQVFPKLQKVCEQRGARFQAIDMRWGVREEAALDHRTMEICLAEVARCQKTGVKPNFIVVLGDRYGWVPLPARIPQDEFEVLLASVTPDEKRLLVFQDSSGGEVGWYRLDRNAVPPEYLLKPRGKDYIRWRHWEPVETRIRDILQRAANEAGLASEALLKYSASATHQEIVAGLGKDLETREQVFVFLRNPDGPKDAKLYSLIESLRQDLPPGNIFSFREGDLEMLCDQVTQSLQGMIMSQGSRFQSLTALEREKQAHKDFARERATHFIGRRAVISEIRQYLKTADARPMLLHGPSGSGKSSILANVLFGPR